MVPFVSGLPGFSDSSDQATGLCCRGTGAKVLRGGAWNNNNQNARAAIRNSSAPADRVSNVGFRCAQE
ncbi:MAG: SUMF1/EgtB/PvdO family nonheme iron enzyme, partial [Anaerolineales bacterium]|nr:SUMF1/EgtB/PvdO family nonheme iron enzyme [Anaerolineales bacterium]